MSLRNTAVSYGSVAKTFHWLTSFLIFCLLIIGFLMDDLASGSLKSQTYNLHKLAGLLVLLLTLLRLTWGLVNSKPLYPDILPAWQHYAAYCVHYGLYIGLIAMPISGWIMSTAAGRIPHLFNINLAAPGITPDEALAKLAGNIHYYLAWYIICLLVLHIAAALKHYYIDKDNVLQRMLP